MMDDVESGKRYTCSDCGALFAHASNMYRHRTKYCSMKDKPSYGELVAKVQQLEQTLQEVTALVACIGPSTVGTVGTVQNITVSDNAVTINNNSTTTNNQISVHINTFGNEQTAHITPDFLCACVKAMEKGIVSLVKEKHFSQKYPGNRNIRIESKKNREMAAYNGDIWESKPQKEFLEHLFRINTETLDIHFCDNEDQFKALSKHKMIDSFFEKARNDDPSIMKKVTQDIFYMIMNEGKKRISSPW